MNERNRIIKYLDPRTLIPFILRETLTLVVGVTVISFYLIIFLISLPMYLFRFVLSKTTKHFNSNLGKMVTARGQFLAIEKFTGDMQKSPRSNILAVLVVDGYVSVDEAKGIIQEKILDAVDSDTGQLSNPELRQFVTSYMGYKYWKPDPNFNIDNHVRAASLRNGTDTNGKEDGVVSMSEIDDLMEVFLNQTFPPNRSPWEFVLVHNCRNSHCDNSTVVLLRYHHCLTDGYGALYSFVSNLLSEPPVIPKPQYPSRGFLQTFIFQLTFPFRMIREVSRFIVLSMQYNPWKVKDDKKEWKLLYTKSPFIPTARIKEIKTRFGVCFTSVVHSCLAAAMQKCLVAQIGAQRAKQFGRVTSVIMLPLPNHPHKLRNHVTAACLPLPIMQLDSVERLKLCEKDIMFAKNSTMPFVAQFLPVIGGSMFSGLAKIIGKNRSFPVSISNFPVGETVYESAGHRVVEFYATAGMAAGVAGLGFLIYSYAGEIQVSVVGEKAIFSREELKIIAQGFADEVDILHKLAVV